MRKSSPQPHIPIASAAAPSAPYTMMSDIMADDFWVGGANANDNQNWHLMANFDGEVTLRKSSPQPHIPIASAAAPSALYIEFIYIL